MSRTLDHDPIPFPRDPEIVYAQDLPEDFVRHVSADDTVYAWLHAMIVMTHQPPITDMYDALHHHVQRGRPGMIMLDGYNRLKPNDGEQVVWKRPVRNGVPEIAHWHATRNDLYAFHEAGGEVVETNPPTWVNYLHTDVLRNHSKSAGYIKTNPDDSAVYFGGVNFYEKGLQNLDFMVKFHGLHITRRILQTAKALAQGRYDGPPVAELTPEMLLLVDQPRLPLDTPTIHAAYRLANTDSARRIRFTSQYAIDPIMIAIFRRQLEQEKQVDLILRQPKKPGSIQHLVELRRRYPDHFRLLLTKDRDIHSKLMLAYEDDGETPMEAAWGSSNMYAQSGVAMTKEMNIHSSNKPLNRKLHGVFENFAAQCELVLP